MNQIDDAILEGLLENRIYAIESKRFLTECFHPRPCWTELKFGEMWFHVQFSKGHFGTHVNRQIRSSWAAYMDPNRELHLFDVSTRCEIYLQYEMQKNMTE